MLMVCLSMRLGFVVTVGKKNATVFLLGKVVGIILFGNMSC